MGGKCSAWSLACGKDSLSVAIPGFARVAMVGSNGFSQSGNFLDLLERLTKKGLRGIRLKKG